MIFVGGHSFKQNKHFLIASKLIIFSFSFSLICFFFVKKQIWVKCASKGCGGGWGEGNKENEKNNFFHFSEW